jgi:hypothetical protein
VLQHDVQVGVEELETEKLSPLMRLRYHKRLSDAVADLGAAPEIKSLLVDNNSDSMLRTQRRAGLRRGSRPRPARAIRSLRLYSRPACDRSRVP